MCLRCGFASETVPAEQKELRSSLSLKTTVVQRFAWKRKKEWRGERSRGNKGSYCFIESSQEVDLICQTVCLGLQFNLVHVGSVYILKKPSTTWNQVNTLTLTSVFSFTSLLKTFHYSSGMAWTGKAMSVPLGEKALPVIGELTFFRVTNSFSAAVRLLISSSYLQEERCITLEQ